MFTKTKEQLGHAISIPAKNAAMISYIAVALACVAILIAVIAVRH